MDGSRDGGLDPPSGRRGQSNWLRECAEAAGNRGCGDELDDEDTEENAEVAFLEAVSAIEVDPQKRTLKLLYLQLIAPRHHLHVFFTPTLRHRWVQPPSIDSMIISDRPKLVDLGVTSHVFTVVGAVAIWLSHSATKTRRCGRFPTISRAVYDEYSDED